jgi:hypothetical protein
MHGTLLHPVVGLAFNHSTAPLPTLGAPMNLDTNTILFPSAPGALREPNPTFQRELEAAMTLGFQWGADRVMSVDQAKSRERPSLIGEERWLTGSAPGFGS